MGSEMCIRDSNKFVKRPVHPFPSTKEILQAIPSKKEASIFAKLDAVHGYFQLALDQQSSYITTFLLPQGKFRYLRAPMGLNASSDEWCCHSDAIVQCRGAGCRGPWARKIVDDTIIWAPDITTLEERLRTVMDRCRELNVTISKKKFEVGETIYTSPDTSSQQTDTDQTTRNMMPSANSQHPHPQRTYEHS